MVAPPSLFPRKGEQHFPSHKYSYSPRQKRSTNDSRKQKSLMNQAVLLWHLDRKATRIQTKTSSIFKVCWRAASQMCRAATSQQPEQIQEGTAQSPEQRLHLGQGHKEECSLGTGSYLEHKTRSEGCGSSLHYESLHMDTHKRSKTWYGFEGWRRILKGKALRLQMNLNCLFVFFLQWFSRTLCTCAYWKWATLIQTI